MNLQTHTEQLYKRKCEARLMGGDSEVEKQHKQGKLTARERIAYLCDADTFFEVGVLNSAQSLRTFVPADGVIAGLGQIDRRPVGIIAYDFTVMAGSMGHVGETKVARLRRKCRDKGIPLVWLLDSAGARIQEFAGSIFAKTGELFRDQVLMSGIVPQVGAVMGPTAAGTSYIAALADFVPMVKDIGTMALGGPTLVKTAVGEEIGINELGGSTVHTTKSGVGHLECEDDRSCLDAIKRYLSFLPSSFRAPLPKHSTPAPTRLSDEIFSILPQSARRGFDVRKIIHWLADGNDFFEIQPGWAKNIVVGFIRIGGHPLGIVANQSMVLGGALDLDASDKAAHFMNTCNAFGVPLLFLHDCPGFMVGSQVEHAGIIRHGAKMLYAVSRLTVPKFSIVVRKSFGAGYYVMCGSGYQPDLIVAWPGSQISLMSPQGAVAIIGKENSLQEYEQKVSASLAAEQGHIDDVIDPRDSAKILAHQLDLLVPAHNKERERRLEKKHGVSPV